MAHGFLAKNFGTWLKFRKSRNAQKDGTCPNQNSTFTDFAELITLSHVTTNANKKMAHGFPAKNVVLC